MLEICDRLDGLPLAIELAAARAWTMPLADLASRLNEGFRLLRGQRRAKERHQRLRATVAWSYALLNADQQLVFDRLSVCVGGFTLAAAEAVAGADELIAVDVDDLVASLVDKSMILTDHSGRYLLLETLRQFGEEQLQVKGNPDRFRRAHMKYFTALAVAGHDGLQGPDEGVWWRRLLADWANIRGAFGWEVATQGVDASATIATQLIWVANWHDTGEPFLWIDTVGELPGLMEHPLRAGVSQCLGETDAQSVRCPGHEGGLALQRKSIGKAHLFCPLLWCYAG